MSGILLLVLGIVVVVAIIGGVVYHRKENNEEPSVTWQAVISGLIAGFLVFSISFITVVPVGHVGVPILFGKVLERDYVPGFHLVSPFVSVKKLDGRIQELTMHIPASDVQTEQGQTTMDVLMNDGLRVFLDTTLWYRLDIRHGHDYVLNVAGEPKEMVALPQLRGAARDVAVNYSSNDIYAHPQKREEFAKNIFGKFCNKAEAMWIQGTDFTIRKVKLPDQLEKAIENKMKMDQEAQEMVYKITKEQKEKERKIVEAQGIAQSNQIIQTSLSKEYLQWYFIQTLPKIAEFPSNTIMLFPYDSSITPVFDISKFMKSINPVPEKK